MPDSKSPNAKIYDRPERKGPSLPMMAVALIVVLLIGLLVFKLIHHSAPAPSHAGAASSARIFNSEPSLRFATGNYFAATG